MVRAVVFPGNSDSPAAATVLAAVRPLVCRRWTIRSAAATALAAVSADDWAIRLPRSALATALAMEIVVVSGRSTSSPAIWTLLEAPSAEK
jgi:hypothetical protein